MANTYAVVLLKNGKDYDAYPATNAKVITYGWAKFDWVGSTLQKPFTELKALKIENGNNPPIYIGMGNVEDWKFPVVVNEEPD